MIPLVLSLIVLGGLVGLWAVCSGADEELDAAIADFFEPSDTEVDERFNDIVAELRTEADWRICEAHLRNLTNLPEIDGRQQP